ncbi:MAG: CotH kinase family protein [Bacteroidales bacterium]|nr:CotH kinase family protein [Bacteroidales bacterium]
MIRAFATLLILCIAIIAKAQQFTQSNLPIVIISTFGIPIPDEPKIPGVMKIIDNGTGQINHINDPGNIYDGNIGIEVRGHFSAWLPQKPYAVETRDGNQNDLDVPLFGFPEESDWVLLANYNDKVFMRNTLAFKLFNNMGEYASRTRFCEVMVNNVYQGIYIFGEKIKRDDGRVDIAKLTELENSGEPLTGGYIFKIDYWDQDNSWQSPYHPIGHQNFDVHYVYEYPDPAIITVQQKNYIKSYVSSFESALYSNNFKDPVFGYRPFIDENAFIDYFLVNELSRNNDGFKKSFFFHKDRDSLDRRIKLGPVWDFDWAWKNIDECQIFKNTDGSGWAYMVNDCYPDVSSPGWHIRLLQDPWFANKIKCRYTELRSGLLSEEQLFNYIDSNATYLWEAQERHYIRWPILGLNVGTPVVGLIPTTFQGEIDGFKAWISLRLTWLDQNMPGICSVEIQETESSVAHPLLFPNPSVNIAYIDMPFDAMNMQVRITNLAGQIIEVPYKLIGSTFQLEVGGLNPGMYLCNISDPSKSATYNLRLLVAK